MRRVILCATGALLLAGFQGLGGAHPNRTQDVSLYGPVFTAGGLNFTVPSKWQVESAVNTSRAGQWQIPPLHGEGEGGEAVLFFFGPGIGGNAKENIEAWIGTMLNAEGQPAAAKQTHRQTAGLKISEVVIFGTYNQVVPMPGIPPVAKPNYGLVGLVIEGPQGFLYWRFTGPEALITANLPLFNKVVDSLKLPAK